MESVDKIAQAAVMMSDRESNAWTACWNNAKVVEKLQHGSGIDCVRLRLVVILDCEFIIVVMAMEKSTVDHRDW